MMGKVRLLRGILKFRKIYTDFDFHLSTSHFLEAWVPNDHAILVIERIMYLLPQYICTIPSSANTFSDFLCSLYLLLPSYFFAYKFQNQDKANHRRAQLR